LAQAPSQGLVGNEQVIGIGELIARGCVVLKKLPAEVMELTLPQLEAIMAQCEVIDAKAQIRDSCAARSANSSKEDFKTYIDDLNK
jgi:hypothetical protein